MTESQREAVLLDFVRRLQSKGSWCGETHIQKSTYFLQEFTHVPLDLNYIFYKHGAHSFELNDLLTALLGNALIELRSLPPYGPYFLPSCSAERFLDLYPRTVKTYEKQMDYVADRLANKNVPALQRLSTALYVHLEIPRKSENEKSKRVIELTLHVSYGEAIADLKEVKEMEHESTEIPT